MTDFYVGGSTSFIGEANVGSPSDLEPTPTDDEGAGWVGIYRTIVTGILTAGALASARAQEAQAAGVRGGWQDEVGKIVLSEDYYLAPTFVDGGYQIRFTVVGDELPRLHIDEDGYQGSAPWPSVARQAALWEPDDLAVTAATIVDDDGPLILPLAVPVPRVQPVVGAEDELPTDATPFGLDEDGIVAAPTLSIRPPPAGFLDDEQIVPQPVVLSEDYYVAPTFTDGGTLLLFVVGGDDIPQPAAPFGLDEEGVSGLLPWPVPLPPVGFQADESWPTPAAPFGLDEDGYVLARNPYAVPPTVVILVLLDDTVTSFGIDEDGVSGLRPWPAPSPYRGLLDEDPWPTPAAPFGLDEDGVLGLRPWSVRPPPLAFHADEAWPTPSAPFALDDDPGVLPARTTSLRALDAEIWRLDQPELALLALEDDGFHLPRSWAASVARALLVDDGSIPIQPFWLDEFFYHAPPPWPVPVIFQPFVPAFEVMGSSLIAAVVEAVQYPGKYRPEWASALIDLREAQGFDAEHQSALADLRDAGI